MRQQGTRESGRSEGDAAGGRSRAGPNRVRAKPPHGRISRKLCEIGSRRGIAVDRELERSPECVVYRVRFRAIPRLYERGRIESRCAQAVSRTNPSMVTLQVGNAYHSLVNSLDRIEVAKTTLDSAAEAVELLRSAIPRASHRISIIPTRI